MVGRSRGGRGGTRRWGGEMGSTEQGGVEKEGRGDGVDREW